MFFGHVFSSSPHFQRKAGGAKFSWLDPLAAAGSSDPQATFAFASTDQSQNTTLPNGLDPSYLDFALDHRESSETAWQQNGGQAWSDAPQARRPELVPSTEPHLLVNLEPSTENKNLSDRSPTVTSGTVFDDNVWTAAHTPTFHTPIQICRPGSNPNHDLLYVTTPAGLTGRGSSLSDRAGDEYVDEINPSQRYGAQSKAWCNPVPDDQMGTLLTFLFPELYGQGDEGGLDMQSRVGTSHDVASNTCAPQGVASISQNFLDPYALTSSSFNPQELELTANTQNFEPQMQNYEPLALLESVKPTVAQRTRTTTKREQNAKRHDLNFTFESGIRKFHTSRRRKPFSGGRKLEVALTRVQGACFVCKLSKITCLQLPGVSVCEKCTTKGVSHHGLCFRLDLTDCAFFRMSSFLQPGPLRSEVDWTASTTVTLTLAMAYIPGAPTLQIDCRPFKPIETDLVGDYTRGADIGAVIKVPTYAAINLPAIEDQIRVTARPVGLACVGVLENRSASPIIVRVLRGAFAYAAKNPQSIVCTALDLWAGSWMCAFDRSLEGEETLGQAKIRDPTSPLFDQVPIPLMLDVQCDTVTINWMQKLASILMKLLWTRVAKKNHDDWFEIFLTVFIMVDNLERVYGVAKELAHQYMLNAEDLAPQVRRLSSAMMDQWSWSVKHLLFVYKKFFKKGYPLSDQALVDTARQLNPDEPTKELINYLLQHRGMWWNAGIFSRFPESRVITADDGATGSGSSLESPEKAEDDFDYEMYWLRELFVET